MNHITFILPLRHNLKNNVLSKTLFKRVSNIKSGNKIQRSEPVYCCTVHYGIYIVFTHQPMHFI